MIVSTGTTARPAGPAHGHRRGRRRRGAVAVELALSLTFLVIPMMLGIWEIGCLLDAQQALVDAVREGGRQASTGLMTDSQVQQVVLRYLGAAGINTSNVTVTVINYGTGADASQAAQLDPLVVTVQMPFKNVDWTFTQQYVSDSTVLSSSCRWYSAKDVPYAVTQTAPAQ